MRAPATRQGALLLVVGLAAALLAGCSPWAPSSGRPAGEPTDGVRDAFPTPAEPAPEIVRSWSEVTEAAPLVRVGLRRDAERVAVGCESPFTIVVYAESVSVHPGHPDASWRIEAAGRGLRGSSGRGSFDVAAGTVRAVPSGGGPISVDGTAYRGEVEIFLDTAGKLAVVNVIDLESYLRGVVPLEIGPRPSEELEAVKSQAVAARTYALASGGGRAGGDYDMHSTVADQVYGGVAAEHATSDRAVLETAGLVLEHDGALITAYFHANCGGRTEARHEVWELAQVPYLKSVWDTPGGARDVDRAYCRNGTGFTWSVTWRGEELDALVREHLRATASTPVEEVPGRLVDLRISERTPSGRVRWLEIVTDGGAWRIFGDRCRWLLRREGGAILRSAWFDLEVERRGGRVVGVTATGRGYGHGIGMCQHGALELARLGRAYPGILAHYYPGSRIVREY